MTDCGIPAGVRRALPGPGPDPAPPWARDSNTTSNVTAQVGFDQMKFDRFGRTRFDRFDHFRFERYGRLRFARFDHLWPI